MRYPFCFHLWRLVVLDTTNHQTSLNGITSVIDDGAEVKMFRVEALFVVTFVQHPKIVFDRSFEQSPRDSGNSVNNVTANADHSIAVRSDSSGPFPTSVVGYFQTPK